MAGSCPEGAPRIRSSLTLGHCCRDRFQGGCGLVLHRTLLQPTLRSSFSCPGLRQCDGVGLPWELPWCSSMRNPQGACVCGGGMFAGLALNNGDRSPPPQKLLCGGSPIAVVNLTKTHHFIDSLSFSAPPHLPSIPVPGVTSRANCLPTCLCLSLCLGQTHPSTRIFTAE